MMPGNAQPTTSQPEPMSLDPDNVSGRPDHVDVIQSLDRPIPETAVLAPPEPQPRRMTPLDIATINERRPLHGGTVYITLTPEMYHLARRIAYAYVNPSPSSTAADATIRDAIHAVLPGLEFDILAPNFGATKTVRFLTPEGREAAMEKQPFALPGGNGGVVKLMREGETPNVRRSTMEYIVHVALLDYPKEQRNDKDIQRNCCNFGHVIEVDPACYAAPDMSAVGVVVQLHHPREIPREVRIRYSDFVIPPCLRYRHVVPVQIRTIWGWDDESGDYIDANGEKYVPVYSDPAAAAAAAAAATP